MNDGISLLIPCRGEERSIPLLLRELEDALHGVEGIDVHFCGAAFGSASSASLRTWTHPELAAVSIVEAVVHCARGLSSEFVLVMDADLQHPAATARELIEAQRRNQVDLVVAARDWRASRHALPIWRRWLSRALIWLIQVRSASKLSDPLSGFFLTRRTLVTGLDCAPSFKPLLALLSQHPNLRSSEITFALQPRLYGSSHINWRRAWQTLRSAWAIR